MTDKPTFTVTVNDASKTIVVDDQAAKAKGKTKEEVTNDVDQA